MHDQAAWLADFGDVRGAWPWLVAAPDDDGTVGGSVQRLFSYRELNLATVGVADRVKRRCSVERTIDFRRSELSRVI